MLIYIYIVRHRNAQVQVLSVVSVYVQGSLISPWLHLGAACSTPLCSVINVVLSFLLFMKWSWLCLNKSKHTRLCTHESTPQPFLCTHAESECINYRFKSHLFPCTLRKGATIVGEVNISFKCHWKEAADKRGFISIMWNYMQSTWEEAHPVLEIWTDLQ